MIILTKAQREALKRLYDRQPIYPHLTLLEEQMVKRKRLTVVPITYRQFRRGVQPGPDCIMIQWCNMWLGIEPDGYTHS